MIPILGDPPRNDQEVEQLFDQACKANPEGLILTLRGLWLLTKGRPAEAEVRFREAVTHGSVIFPEAIRLDAHEAWLQAEGEQFVGLGVTFWNLNPMVGPNGRPLDKAAVEALKARVRDNIPNYLKLGPPRQYIANHAVALTWIVGDQDRSFYLAREAIKKWPNDEVMKKRLEVMRDAGYIAPASRVSGK